MGGQICARGVVFLLCVSTGRGSVSVRTSCKRADVLESDEVRGGSGWRRAPCAESERRAVPHAGRVG